MGLRRSWLHKAWTQVAWTILLSPGNNYSDLEFDLQDEPVLKSTLLMSLDSDVYALVLGSCLG